MTDASEKKTLAWTIYKIVLLCIVCIAVIVSFYYAYNSTKLPAIELSNKIDESNDNFLNNNYEDFIEAYESLNFFQKMYVSNIERVENVYQTFREAALNATLVPITQEQIEIAQANAKAVAENKQSSSETTMSNLGEMSKDYEPKENEPNWIEITAYCETLMPDVIGYEADISTDENYTKIIRTNLRYKVETSRLKIKPEGSYHKAIFIIEFEDENYKHYEMTTAEVDGEKFI